MKTFKESEVSVSQRLEVVLMLLLKQEPISVLARRCGVSETPLHRWRERIPGTVTCG